MERNEKVRKAIREAGLKQWQVAYLLKIHESEFSRKLRFELPEEEQNKIIEAVQKYSERSE